jgi:hypothetical protein
VAYLLYSLNELSQAEPEMVAKSIAGYDQFTDEVNLIEVPDDYDVLVQLQKNVARNKVEEVTDKVPALD